MKARQKRLMFLVAGLAALGVAIALVLSALEGNLSYFFSPSEVVAGKAPQDHVFRIGGLVKDGSLKRSNTDLSVDFVVTDNQREVEVRYTGILPDLFKEGQGMIATGKLGSDGIFVADEVLAKHDEEYMPPEVAAALEKGHKEGVAAMKAGESKPL